MSSALHVASPAPRPYGRRAVVLGSAGRQGAAFDAFAACSPHAAREPQRHRHLRAVCLPWALKAFAAAAVRRQAGKPSPLPLDSDRAARRRIRAASRPQVSAAGTSGGGVTQTAHVLPDGVSLEVLCQRSTRTSTLSSPSRVREAPRPPLVFLHGVGHAAWCWVETFFPFFAAQGHDCFALSFRGQGGSGAGEGAEFAGSTAQHAADLAHFLASLPEDRFVLVAHSYGGLVAQHALLVPPQPHATSGAAPVLAAAIMQPDSLRRRARGLALLASLPPSGYGSVAARIAAGGGRRDTAEPRIVVGVPSDPAVCRRKYFATDMPLDKIRGFMEKLLASSRLRLVDFSAQETPLPPPPLGFPLVLVMCGDEDFIVDAEAVRETAAVFGTRAVELPRVAHDLMLDVRWESAAQALEAWLETLEK